MAAKSGIVKAGSEGYTYDFGIAIARSAISDIGILSAKALTLTAAIYGLSTVMNDLESILKKNRIIFGGYLNTFKALQFAQDKLLKGQTEFDSDDVLDGMRKIQVAGLNARKTFQFVNDAAQAAGVSFSQMGSLIEGAINSGNLQGFVELGIMTQNQTRYFERYTAGTNAMRNAVMRFLTTNKTLSTAIKGNIQTIQGQIRRLKSFAYEFGRAIVGDPTDPNSLYNTVKNTIIKINEFLKEHLPEIKKFATTIGLVISWVVRNVGHFVKWMLDYIGRQIKAVRLGMGTFQDHMMSMLLWLELVKDRTISIFHKYGSEIKFLLKLFLTLWAAKKVLGILMIGGEAIASVWRYGKAFAGAVRLITRAGGLADYLTILIGRSSVLRGVLRFLNISLIGLRNGLWAVGDAIIMLVTKPLTALRAAWVFITDGIVAATGAAWEFVAALAVNPVTWIVVAVIALVAWVIYLVKHWDEVQKATQKWGDTILLVTSWLMPVVGIPLLLAKHWDTFKGIFINIWRTISNVAQVFWFKLKDWSSWAWDSIKQDFQAVGAWFQKYFKPISDFFTNIWNGIKDAFTWLKNLLMGSGDNWIGRTMGFFGKAFGGMADASAQALIQQRRLHGQAYGDVQGAYDFDPKNPDTKPSSPQATYTYTGQDPNPLLKQNKKGGSATPPGFSPADPFNAPDSGSYAVAPGAIVINVYGDNKAEDIANKVDKILKRRQLDTKSRKGEH